VLAGHDAVHLDQIIRIRAAHRAADG